MKEKRACSVLSNFKTKLSLKLLHTFSADENVLNVLSPVVIIHQDQVPLPHSH